MIKIHQHLNRVDADVYLDSLALKLWGFLNQKKQGNEYRLSSLIKKLDNLILEAETQDFLENISLNNNEILKRQKDVLIYLKNKNYHKLKACVISKPDELFVLRNEILGLINFNELFYVNGDTVSHTPFGEKLISSLFNYNNFRKSSFCVELLHEAGFENVTCPYCNDNPINIVDISDEKDENTISRAYLELDHFFPKSRIPFFALSFYNLIPSCGACNATEKRDKDFCISTHVNPYFESFNDIYKFFVNPYPLALGERPSIEIKQLGNKNDLSSTDLKLESRYNIIHKGAVLNLIKMYQNYRTKGGYYNKEFGLDWEEALLQNVPKTENEILRKRAGKMYLDIVKQIDEIGILNL
ncbi:hypothetical protein [Confluentibacter sediminis]|uniref:hypothetical protein n=1 Tax=Confluentibacter sediminis TaxID=2219045 RepID=UPI000DAEE218|nr:hypothetical protein [Confluentibacter sediminis]